MPSEAGIPLNLWILLATILFFVLIIWTGQLRLGSRLKKIEQQMFKTGGAGGRTAQAEEERKADEKEQYLFFQEFLDEDPQRQDLPKKEQFAAFRKWRREKGLNWNSESRG